MYLAEQGSVWMRTQFYLNAGSTIFISQATLVEAVATICRKAREQNPAQRITEEERDRLITLFRRNARYQYQIIKVTVSLYTEAGNLCCNHQLRAYDAIQLACALVAHNKLTSSGQVSPIFISADDKLLEIAVAEGFSVENPNKYL